MFRPTEPTPVPLEELGWINTSYLASAKPRCDPYLIWGTYADMESLEPFLAEARKETGTLISTAHVLVGAVARSLREHPYVNRRVAGRRVYNYREVNVVMPMLQTSTGEVDCIFIRGADRLTLKGLAERFWNEARERAMLKSKRQQEPSDSKWSRWDRVKRWLHLRWVHRMSRTGFYFANRFRLPVRWKWQQELNAAGAFVNYLGSPGAPPLINHKLAALPMNSYSIAVTLGPIDLRPAVVNGAVAVRKEASLFVRLDHRFVNGHQAGEFVKTLRTYLMHPQLLMELPEEESSSVSERRVA